MGGVIIFLGTTLLVVYLYCKYHIVGGILIFLVLHCELYTYIVSTTNVGGILILSVLVITASKHLVLQYPWNS